MTTPDPRRFLALFEPLVAMIYFSPEAFDEYAKIGVSDGWTAYFCSRAAAMGPVSPEVVAATFFNFNPAMIRRTLRWDVAPPEEVYGARLRGVRRSYERLLEGLDLDLPRINELLRVLVEACPPQGRPLAAAHATLPWPEEPMLGLWHGGNVLREFRGDGHVAVLLTLGVGPVEAILLHAGYMGYPRDDKRRQFLFMTREWDEQAQAAGEASLRERGFLDGDAMLTDGGAKFRGMIEHDTDRAAAAPFAELGQERCDELSALLEPVAVRILEKRGAPSALGRMDPQHPLR